METGFIEMAVNFVDSLDSLIWICLGPSTLNLCLKKREN